LRNAATDFGPAQRRLATTIQKLGWRAAPFTAVMRFARWVDAILLARKRRSFIKK
jgi:hypothetical protein